MVSMAHTIFVASGLNFAVDKYLRHSPFKPKSVFHKGTIPPMDNPRNIPRPDSGFVVWVNGDNQPPSNQQWEMALSFLALHEQELLKLKKVGVDNMLFDFRVMRPAPFLDHYVYFPPELLKAMARFGMGLTISNVLIPEE